MACLSGQIGEVKVLWEEGLTFNHAALLFNIYPTDSIALIPAPAPTGYKTKLNKQDSWVEVFYMSLPLCLPYMPPHSTVLVDPSTIRRVLAHKYLELLVKAFDNAIEEACKKMLKPKQALDSHSTAWWNEQCSGTYSSTKCQRQHRTSQSMQSPLQHPNQGQTTMGT
jgi:hypothetical protein